MFPLIEYDNLLATLMGMFSGELRRKLGALKYDLGWMVGRLEAMSADNEKYHADKVALADYCSEIGLENPLTLEQLINSHRLTRGLLQTNRNRVAELQDTVSMLEDSNERLIQGNNILRTANALGSQELELWKERSDGLVAEINTLRGRIAKAKEALK